MRDNNKIEGNDLSEKSSESMGTSEQPNLLWRVAYIAYVGTWVIISINLLVGLWPQRASGAQSSAVHSAQALWGALHMTVTEELQFILIVAIMGALGGLVYSVTLFAHYVGRREFENSYGCWYVLRPLIGAILAVIFYLAFRGAFFTFSTDTQSLNISGIAALGGLVGIFSQETMEKLRDLAENFFNVTDNQST